MSSTPFETPNTAVSSTTRLSPPGRLRRLGSAIGLATISLLDLLALEDITTAGAWMPEIVFLIASVPALITLGHYVLWRPDPETRRGADDPGGGRAPIGR